jgi:hypothetical protein
VQYGFNEDAFESGPHVATVTADLLEAEVRTTTLDPLFNLWRERVGTIPDVINIKFTGFAVPIGRWFADELAPMLRRRLLESAHLPSLGFARSRLEQMIDDHGHGACDHTHRLFALLALSMWLDWRVDPQPPAPLAP